LSVRNQLESQRFEETVYEQICEHLDLERRRLG